MVVAAGGRRKSLCLEPLMINERVTPLNREAVSDYNSLLVPPCDCVVDI